MMPNFFYRLFINVMAGLWVIAFVVVLIADWPEHGTVFEVLAFDTSGVVHELIYMFAAMVCSFLAFDWLHERLF